jgi:hypothetical protein
MVDAVAATVGNGQVIDCLEYDFSAGQVVTVSGSAASSSAFTQGYVVAVITSTTNCWYAIGAAAAAHTAGSDYLPAGVKWKVKFPQGAVISVIQDSAGGFLSVMPARTFPI